MRPLPCENLRSEPFPDIHWKFIERRVTMDRPFKLPEMQ